MAEAQNDDKTEPATPRRLQRAREDGQVPVSRELTTFAGLAAVTLTLMIAGPDTLQSPDIAAEHLSRAVARIGA